MQEDRKVPFYAKFASVTIGVFGSVIILYTCRGIIIPLAYGTIIAILLNPLVKFMVKRGMNRVVAIFIVVLITVVAFIGGCHVISAQLTNLGANFPVMLARLQTMEAELVLWAGGKFRMDNDHVLSVLKWADFSSFGRDEIGDGIERTWQVLIEALLLPVYIFLVLLYKTLLLEFVRKLFGVRNKKLVEKVLANSIIIIQSYVIGLFLEMLIMAFLNSLVLVVLGIPYALLLAVAGAILNLIPYLGGILAAILPMLVALVTKNSSYALAVLGLYLIIQYADTHFILPHIVAKRVRINALVSIVAVSLGAELWGFPGMFLSIPVTAILKVIFDHIDVMKPWGLLLGNIIPTRTRLTFIGRKDIS